MLSVLKLNAFKFVNKVLAILVGEGTDGEGQIIKVGGVDAGNSTSTVLAAGGIFTGTWIDASSYSSMVIAVATDQNGTFTVQFSTNGTNTDSTLTKYYRTTQINPPHRFTITRKYMRVTFTNTSASDQTYLRLQVLLGEQTDLNATIDSVISQNYDATVVRPTDFSLDVARNLVQGVAFANKFGRNSNTVAGDTIWSSSSAYTEPASAERCNVVSSDVDDAAGDTGARTILITGIDENYDIVTETVTLNGTNNVLTANKYWNIHRSYVTTAGTDAGAEGTITITSTASGTPVLGQISVGSNQTQSTIYMVPRNYTAYINLPNVAGQNTVSNATCDIICMKKDFGGVFRIQMDFHLTGGSTAYQPKVFGAPIKWDAKSTILFKCQSTTGTGTWDIAVDYDIWLIRDE